MSLAIWVNFAFGVTVHTFVSDNLNDFGTGINPFNKYRIRHFHPLSFVMQEKISELV